MLKINKDTNIEKFICHENNLSKRIYERMMNLYFIQILNCANTIRFIIINNNPHFITTYYNVNTIQKRKYYNNIVYITV